MKLSVKQTSLEKIKTDILIIGCFEKEKFSYTNIDKKLKGAISKSYKSKKFEGEFKKIISFSTLGLLSAEKVLLVGMGKKKEFNLEKLRKVSGFTAKIARDSRAVNYATNFLEAQISKKSIEERAQAITEGILLGLYKFDKYKTENNNKSKLKEVLILTKDSKAENGVKKGIILAEAVVQVRDLVNMPPCDLTPTVLANEAKKIAKQNNIKITIFDKKALQKKGMNAILGVSKGSSEEPRLVILETNPKAKKKIAIVGKGITFDSGGINIKPTPYLLEMKMDMAGAATVLATTMIASKLKLNVNVLGIMACSENMLGAAAQKPGDIITSYSKKTIEIANTDAEGRLVLADAVAYAEEQKPDAIIDLATLTGAAIVILGYVGAPMVSNDEKVKKALNQASKNTDERIWELPLWQEFRDAIKGEVADVKNLGKGMEAGTITAATFIEAFVKKTPWGHLDIAGIGFVPEDNDYITKGGTGFGVRLLVNMLENWK